MNAQISIGARIRRRRPAGAALGVLAAAVLLVLTSSVTYAGSAPAQPGDSNNLDALTCAPAPVSWTDCNITLNRAIPAGGSVIAAVQGAGASLAYCSDGSLFNSFCGAYGNEAVFYCPMGCEPGQQFDVSATGTSAAALTQALNVALGPTDLAWPGPGGIPSSNTAVGVPDNAPAAAPVDTSGDAGSRGSGDTAPAGMGGN